MGRFSRDIRDVLLGTPTARLSDLLWHDWHRRFRVHPSTVTPFPESHRRIMVVIVSRLLLAVLEREIDPVDSLRITGSRPYTSSVGLPHAGRLRQRGDSLHDRAPRGHGLLAGCLGHCDLVGVQPPVSILKPHDAAGVTGTARHRAASAALSSSGSWYGQAANSVPSQDCAVGRVARR